MTSKPDKANPQIKARVPDDLLEEINEYRHARKLESRAEAIVELIRLGLKGDKAGIGINSGTGGIPNGDNDTKSASGSKLNKEPNALPDEKGRHARQ